MTISALFVVYNERDRVRAAILDALPHVDQVVVVDQNSTDGTLEIVREIARDHHGKAQVVIDWHHGYSEASYALGAMYCAGEWIVMLDADETMTLMFKANLRDIIAPHDVDGYKLESRLVLDGKLHYPRDPARYRLFRKTNVRFIDELHAEPQPHVTTRLGTSLDWSAFEHSKSTKEQLDDEQRFERLIRLSDRDDKWKSERLARNWMLNSTAATTGTSPAT